MAFSGLGRLRFLEFRASSTGVAPTTALAPTTSGNGRDVVIREIALNAAVQISDLQRNYGAGGLLREWNVVNGATVARKCHRTW